jgi:hypothetical protein
MLTPDGEVRFRNPFGIYNDDDDNGTQHLPSVNTNVTNAQTWDQQQKKNATGINAFLKRMAIGLWTLVCKLLVWCFPRTLGKKDTEAATSSRAATITTSMAASTISRWPDVIKYACVILVCLGVLAFSGLITMENGEHARLRRNEALMKHCSNHEDRTKILKTAAYLVPKETMDTGILPCGSTLTGLQKRLIKLHNETGEWFLTAKHLNHSYSIVSELNKHTGEVHFLFNLKSDEYAPIGDERPVHHETSQFFPTVGSIGVPRPAAAWVTWFDASGMRVRRKIEGERLRGLLHAWEILTGKHFLRYSQNINAPTD